jgi:hypothetical protein
MPTWCENILHVRGKRNDVDVMVESVHSDELDLIGQPRLFDFNRIVPLPKRLQPFIAKLSMFDDPIAKDHKDSASAALVYWWCIRNWGTKWNASNSKVFPRKYGADVTFDTAWGAPFPVIFKLLEQNPMLAFTLHYRLEDKARYHFFDFYKSKSQ